MISMMRVVVLLWWCASTAVCALCEGVSTVDVSSYVRGEKEATDLDLEDQRKATALAFDAAMREVGMACVTGHGVAASVIDEAERWAKMFFALPAARKVDGGSGSYGFEGYTPRGVEAVGRSTGDETSAADAVESYVFTSRPTFPMTGPYWDEMVRVLGVLLEVSADLGYDFREAYHDFEGDVSLALKFAHYVEDPSAAFRYSRHTDYLTFTILRATQPGLQVELANSTFVDVRVDPAALVVNAADLTELWTNGRWRSAPHQVIQGAHEGDRDSIVFFTGPSLGHLVQPILRPGDEAPRFDPVVAGDYLRRKIDPTTVLAPERRAGEKSKEDSNDEF